MERRRRDGERPVALSRLLALLLALLVLALALFVLPLPLLVLALLAAGLTLLLLLFLVLVGHLPTPWLARGGALTDNRRRKDRFPCRPSGAEAQTIRSGWVCVPGGRTPSETS